MGTEKNTCTFFFRIFLCIRMCRHHYTKEGIIACLRYLGDSLNNLKIMFQNFKKQNIMILFYKEGGGGHVAYISLETYTIYGWTNKIHPAGDKEAFLIYYDGHNCDTTTEFTDSTEDLGSKSCERMNRSVLRRLMP